MNKCYYYVSGVTGGGGALDEIGAPGRRRPAVRARGTLEVIIARSHSGCYWR